MSDVFQKARIKIHEKGTEAAAVTVMETSSSWGPEPVYFKADHPFVYFISEPKSHTVLFIGTYHGEPDSGSGEQDGIRDILMD